MILCPNCQHHNPAGAVFCVECGAQLVSSNATITQTVHTDRIRENLSKGVEASERRIVTTTWLTLHLLDSGHLLPLAERNEFLLGRVSDKQPIMPDIDLSPYDAHAQGVSRLHALLRRKPDNQVIIIDLGSSNGTYLKGQRLEPHREYPLSHGDIIFLGKL
ncbi:MAG: FHA domain-containing protein, partial [Anaerolineales bacterium]